MRSRLTVATLALAAVPVSGAAQDLLIVAPEAESYVSGPLVIQARIEPAGTAVKTVTFFADGASICTVEQAPLECPWDAGSSITEHVIRVVATLTDGRRLVRSLRTRKTGYVEAVEVDAVQVTVSAQDGKGQYVRGIRREEFRLEEDGRPQRIAGFTGENVPLEIVVAVDVSKSMTTAMPVLKQAVRRFLSSLRPRDQVTLLAFNDTIFTPVRRSIDAAGRLRAVDRLSPWGGTALYDAILTSLNTLGRQPGRRALVVFSDGDDQSSVATLGRAEARLDASDATVYTVGLGSGATHERFSKILARIADRSGGRFFSIDNIDRLDAAFDRIVEELSNQYLLSYVSTNEKRDGTWRTISVETSRPGVKVRHRQGYRAPAAGRKGGG